MKRIYVNLTDEQAAALKERAKVTGLLQAEIIRRAIADLAPLELVQSVRKADADRAEFIIKYAKQPVLITPKASE